MPIMVPEIEAALARISQVQGTYLTYEPGLANGLSFLDDHISQLRTQIDQAYVLYQDGGHESLEAADSALKFASDTSIDVILGIGLGLGLGTGIVGAIAEAGLTVALDFSDWANVDLSPLNQDINGTGGDDFIMGGNQTVNINLGEGDDVYISRGSSYASFAHGGSGNDVFILGSASDEAYGDGGDDRI